MRRILAVIAIIVAGTASMQARKHLTPYEYGRSLFISVQGGPLYFNGDYSHAFKKYDEPLKLLAPFGEFAAGYYFDNAQAVRVSLSYSRKHGSLEPVSELYSYKFSTAHVFADYMINLNTIGEYYIPLNPYLYAGLGAAHTFSFTDPEHPYQTLTSGNTVPGARFGALIEYDFPNRLGIFGDAGLDFFPDRYNGQEPVSFPIDMNIHLGFGVVWHLK